MSSFFFKRPLDVLIDVFEHFCIKKRIFKKKKVYRKQPKKVFVLYKIVHAKECRYCATVVYKSLIIVITKNHIITRSSYFLCLLSLNYYKLCISVTLEV